MENTTRSARESRARILTQESLRENKIRIVPDNRAMGQYVIYQTTKDKEGNEYEVVRPIYIAEVVKPTNTRKKKAYMLAYININGKGFTLPLHRLIYIYFKGNFPEGYDIDHIDGDTLNNDIRNLEAVTHKENCIRRANYQKKLKETIDNIK